MQDLRFRLTMACMPPGPNISMLDSITRHRYVRDEAGFQCWARGETI